MTETRNSIGMLRTFDHIAPRNRYRLEAQNDGYVDSAAIHSLRAIDESAAQSDPSITDCTCQILLFTGQLLI